MAQRQNSPFSVMTYNLQAHEEKLAPLLKVIDEADADIVAMQELSDEFADGLLSSFRTKYPYQALHPEERYSINGQGILSRFPVLEDDYWVANMGNQRVSLDIAGKQLTVYNAHPAAPISSGEAARRADIDEVLFRCQQESGPLILLGDFNTPPDSNDYQHIVQSYTDVFAEVGKGSGWTFPDSMASIPIISWFIRPFTRYDYIFRNNALQSISARVWPDSGGSDHRPVLARMRIV